MCLSNFSVNFKKKFFHVDIFFRAAKKKKKADKDVKDEKSKDGKDNKQQAGAKAKGAAGADRTGNIKSQAGAKAHEDGRPESHMTHGSGEENDKYV